MKTFRRLVFSIVVAFLFIAIASAASSGGKAALLVATVVLGWIEWRLSQGKMRRT